MSEYAIMPISDYVSACSALREKTGGTDLIKSGEMSEKINEVYEKGKSDERQTKYDEFWDEYQHNGERLKYEFAFAGDGWSDENFRPKYDIVCSQIQQTFSVNGITDLIGILDKCGVKLDTSRLTSVSYIMQGNLSTINFPSIDLTALQGNPNYLFYGNSSLKVIEKVLLKSDGSQAFTNFSFGANEALEEIRFEGVIGQNGLNLQWSTLLSHDSIVSIINALSTTTSGLSVTLSKTAVNNAFETETGVADGTESAEWSALIATRSNWTISLV